MTARIIECEQGALTKKELFRLFYVNTMKGELRWRAPPKYHPRLKGEVAGGPRRSHIGKQYHVVKIGRKAYKRGRLIFFAATGRWPQPCVDHANGDSLDDRISNLREATFTENARNVRRKKKSTGLPMGVRKTKYGRYQARLVVAGRSVALGCFSTALEAQSAYLSARREHYGEFA